MSLLNPKQIVFSAIQTRFAGYDVQELFLTFDLKQNTCHVLLHNSKGQKIDVFLPESDMKTINALFVTKMLKQLKKNVPEKTIKNIIVNINMSNEDIRIYYDTVEDNKQMFEFEF